MNPTSRDQRAMLSELAKSEILLSPQRQLLDQVCMALAEIEAGGTSAGIVLSGPAGSGKSTALDFLARPFKNYVDGYQRCIPCCRVSAASLGDAASLIREILSRLGRPSTGSGTKLEPSMFAALVACRVQVLIIEELINSVMSEAKTLQKRTANLLKNLWNMEPSGETSSWVLPDKARGDPKLVIVISGTEALDQVLRDGQLSGRYNVNIRMLRPWFDRQESLQEFSQVLSSIVDRHGLGGVIDSTNIDLLSRTLLACDGQLRAVNALVQRANTLMSDEITPNANALLSRAFNSALRRNETDLNPYELSRDDLKRRVLRESKTSGG